jgi:hypothetical protein
MGGTGLLAVESGVRVVPMWIDVEQKCAVQKRWGPWRGAVTVYLGAPLDFVPGTSYETAVRQIEAAVRALAPGLASGTPSETRNPAAAREMVHPIKGNPTHGERIEIEEVAWSGPLESK